MAAGDLILGLDGAFMWGTAGTTAATQTYNVDDVSLKLTDDFAECLRRGKRFKDRKPTGGTAELSFNLKKVKSDAFRTAIMAAKIAKTRIAAYAREDSTSEGFDADWYVGDVTDGQPNGDFQTLDVTLVYTGEARDGTWH